MRFVDTLFGVAALLAILLEPAICQRRSRLAAGAGQPVEFDCPEEFGYYPHPTDCTQYYVCVFGGALLESCTGGLMYSHELQTCDWPRNVGCGGTGESATISTVRVTDPRTRQTTPTAQGTRAATQVTRDQVQQRQQQEEIAKHQLYADDIGPADEIENDRPQRVYRGQPSSVGQVARDRDGLRHQPVTNSIPATRTSSADKVAVISFGNQQQTQNTQYSFDLLTEDNFLTNETSHRRKKRQARFRYPARILQIVPSGARVPWPTPPSPTVHSTGSGGNFKYQGNLNRNKPPRLTDPINTPDTSFQPVPNPNVPPDVRNFRSPEQYGNSKTRPPPNSKFSNPDSNYGHRPPIQLDPDLSIRQHANSNSNTGTQSNYNSANSKIQHSGGSSSPAHSVIIPSSYATFQNLPDVDGHYPSPQATFVNHSYVRNVPQPNSNVYQNVEEDDNYSYFHLDHANSQPSHQLPTTPSIPLFSASPTLSNLLTTLKNAELLVGQNPQNSQSAVNEQNNLQFLKSLTSMHEVPYNADGTRLYQIPHTHQHELGINSNFNAASLFHHIVSQTNPTFPSLNNYQSLPNSHHVHPDTNEGKSAPVVSTTQGPFTPNTNPYGIKELKPQNNQQDQRHANNPHRFAKPQMEHNESQQKKQVRPTAGYSVRPYDQESENAPSNEYSSEEDDYYDDSVEDVAHDQYSHTPSHFYESTSKLKGHDNPFADINFDFDKYIDKLRGGYQTTVTHSPPPIKQKGVAPGNYEKPDDYDDYSDEEYEEYEESEEKPLSNNEPDHRYQTSPQPLPVLNNKFQTSTESNVHANNDTSTPIYGFPSKDSTDVTIRNLKSNPTVQSKVPETLTVPFFHGPDGNVYSRLPIQPETSYQEGFTAIPFLHSESSSHRSNHKETHQSSVALGAQIRDLKTGQKQQTPTEQTTQMTLEYSGLRERERLPSHKQFQENFHRTKTTTIKPVSSTLKPVTSLKNQQAYYDDFVYSTRPVKNTAHKNRVNNSQPSFESTHIHLFPTKNYHGSNRETTTHTNLEYFSSSDDLKEFASSTTKYPYKTSKGPIPNYHYSDIIVQSTRATNIPKTEGTIKTPSKNTNYNRDQSSHANRGSNYNTSTYTEGANIFSSVKDTISMMSNNSQSPGSNVNIMPSYNKSIASTNKLYTTVAPLSSDTHTTFKTYTIRRRPPKVSSTTPRYRARKPTSLPNSTNSGNQPVSSQPRPQAINTRQNRRPTTKNRLRSTTERTSTTDSDRNESTDKPKSTVSRHNKKLAPDKDGSRTTNSIRVDPSPAPVSYVQQPSLQASPSPPAYNSSQQYDTSQYDPYYSLYDEDVELYRDVDYTQYTSNQGQTNNQQYRGQSPYKQAPQQPEIQSQRNVAYAQPTYNTQDVYTQTAGTQDYNENYNTQLINDQIQYRQQAARQPTKAPSSSNRIESNFSHETTSTTIIPTTSTKPTTIRTTTTTVAPAVVSSRPQTRQRVEVNRSATQPTTRTTSTTTTTTTTTYSIPEEFQTLWNLPAENNPSSEPSLPNLPASVKSPESLSSSATVPENPPGSQRTSFPSAKVAEPKSNQRRITLTASLSLDEPFATGRREGSRGPSSSRHSSYNADESSLRAGSRRGTSEVVALSSSSTRPNKNVQRNQNPPRRVATKALTIADVPNSSSQILSRNSGIISVEDFIPENTKVNNPDTSARRTPLRTTNNESAQLSRATPRRIDTKTQDSTSIPRAAKLVLEPESLRQSPFSTAASKPIVESPYFSESDSETNSLSTSQSLSRNTITQSEVTRGRSRDGTQAKPCRDEVDSNSNSDCSEKPQLRVRPTTASPDSQTTPGPTRGTPSGRNRGSAAYTASTASDTVNRGTPASVRSRPTLKPSTAIVPKSQEFIDIYRFPPQRPDPIYPMPQVDKTAAKCRKDVCLLPDCYCGGKDIPGDFEPEEIPQIVLLTFDDSANDLNKGLYSDLFDTGRKNPNGCPISATFYVSHEWTDYSHVQNLYAGGHEIASHSISHSFGEQFSQKKWTREIGGQREILAAYGGVKLEDVRGMRAPFLAIGGNKMFKMLYDSNFTYDSSMPVYENRPPSWPYTLDYKIFHDCMIPPCPTRSYPGVWEVPMVMWQDLNGGRCSMGDACSNPPTADGVYKMLIKNFERHYTTNRAPFGLFYHAAWFTQPHHKEGFEAFLDTIVNMPDVWLVTNWQALQWMRDPTPLSRINSFQPWQCNYPDRPKKCNNPKVCNLWHKSGVRYMRTCQPCPDIYPWTGKTGVRNSRVDNEVIEE